MISSLKNAFSRGGFAIPFTVLAGIALSAVLYMGFFPKADPKAVFVQTKAVRIAPALVEQLLAAGVTDLSVVPSEYGTPGIFMISVNGKVTPFKNYSQASDAYARYRVDLSQGKPRVYVRKDGMENLTPDYYADLIEEDALAYMHRLEQDKLREEAWQSVALD